jgi:thiosulfate reductase cytochrome b subunit
MEGHPTHPRHVRIAHWINAAILLVALWSGFALLTSERNYAAYVNAIPPGILAALQLTGHRLTARAWHVGMAVAFTANALFYALTSLRRGTLRRILPRRTWLRDAWSATVAEFAVPREALGRGGYNGMQRLAYTAVMGGGLGMMLTGAALYFGKRAPWLSALVGGERNALTIHVVLALSLLAFVLVHVLQVARAGVPALLGMLTGAAEGRPARARRALTWSAGILASLIVAFALANATGGTAGVPVFLRWAVPQHHAARHASPRPWSQSASTAGGEGRS